MKNNMAQIADMLGVTLGKEFYIVGRTYSYLLTNNGLYKVVGGMQSKLNNDTLEHLLLGKLEIDSRFLPSKNESYYVPFFTGTEVRHWENSDEDRYFYDNYLVYATYEKAEEVKQLILRTVKEYNDANKNINKRN